MFYSTQILAKKGPLGLVWMAAHMERGIRKNQVHEASIPATVDALMCPEAPLALRLSGQLLLGLCRLYGKKVAYLLSDCQDALVKIRLAFRADQLGPLRKALAAKDSAGGAPHTAPLEAITLPDEMLILEGDPLDLGPMAPGAALEALMADLQAAAASGDGAPGSASASRYRRRGSLATTFSTGLGDNGLQAYSLGCLIGPSPGSQAYAVGGYGYGSLENGEVEMFDDAATDFAFDLEEIEIERLRAAPAMEAAGAGGPNDALAALLGGRAASASAGHAQEQEGEEGMGDAASGSPSSGLGGASRERESVGGPGSVARRLSMAAAGGLAGRRTTSGSGGAAALLPDIGGWGAELDLEVDLGASPEQEAGIAGLSAGAEAAQAGNTASVGVGARSISAGCTSNIAGQQPNGTVHASPAGTQAAIGDGLPAAQDAEANGGAFGSPVNVTRPEVVAAAAGAAVSAQNDDPYDLPPDPDPVSRMGHPVQRPSISAAAPLQVQEDRTTAAAASCDAATSGEAAASFAAAEDATAQTAAEGGTTVDVQMEEATAAAATAGDAGTSAVGASDMNGEALPSGCPTGGSGVGAPAAMVSNGGHTATRGSNKGAPSSSLGPGASGSGNGGLPMHQEASAAAATSSGSGPRPNASVSVGTAAGSSPAAGLSALSAGQATAAGAPVSTAAGTATAGSTARKLRPRRSFAAAAAPNTAAVAAAQAQPAPARGRAVAAAAPRRPPRRPVALDAQGTTLPTNLMRTWLQDRSELRDRRHNPPTPSRGPKRLRTAAADSAVLEAAVAGGPGLLAGGSAALGGWPLAGPPLLHAALQPAQARALARASAGRPPLPAPQRAAPAAGAGPLAAPALSAPLDALFRVAVGQASPGYALEMGAAAAMALGLRPAVAAAAAASPRLRGSPQRQGAGLAPGRAPSPGWAAWVAGLPQAPPGGLAGANTPAAAWVADAYPPVALSPAAAQAAAEGMGGECAGTQQMDASQGRLWGQGHAAVDCDMEAGTGEAHMPQYGGGGCADANVPAAAAAQPSRSATSPAALNTHAGPASHIPHGEAGHAATWMPGSAAAAAAFAEGGSGAMEWEPSVCSENANKENEGGVDSPTLRMAGCAAAGPLALAAVAARAPAAPSPLQPSRGQPQAQGSLHLLLRPQAAAAAATWTAACTAASREGPGWGPGSDGLGEADNGGFNTDTAASVLPLDLIEADAERMADANDVSEGADLRLPRTLDLHAGAPAATLQPLPSLQPAGHAPHMDAVLQSQATSHMTAALDFPAAPPPSPGPGPDPAPSPASSPHPGTPLQHQQPSASQQQPGPLSVPRSRLTGQAAATPDAASHGGVQAATPSSTPGGTGLGLGSMLRPPRRSGAVSHVEEGEGDGKPHGEAGGWLQGGGAASGSEGTPQPGPGGHAAPPGTAQGSVPALSSGGPGTGPGTGWAGNSGSGGWASGCCPSSGGASAGQGCLPPRAIAALAELARRGRQAEAGQTEGGGGCAGDEGAAKAPTSQWQDGQPLLPRPTGPTQERHAPATQAAAGPGEEAGTQTRPVPCGASIATLAQGRTRRDAARLFYDMLLLHGRGMVALQQLGPQPHAGRGAYVGSEGGGAAVGEGHSTESTGERADVGVMLTRLGAEAAGALGLGLGQSEDLP